MTDLPVWVTTRRFENTTPGPGFINPRCFGEDFALWLTPRLQTAGFEVSEPVQEDWGWILLITDASGHVFVISLGVMDDSVGISPANWYIGVGYPRLQNGFRAWFKPIPFELLQATASTVRGILEAEASFVVHYREP